MMMFQTSPTTSVASVVTPTSVATSSAPTPVTSSAGSAPPTPQPAQPPTPTQPPPTPEAGEFFYGSWRRNEKTVRVSDCFFSFVHSQFAANVLDQLRWNLVLTLKYILHCWNISSNSHLTGFLYNLHLREFCSWKSQQSHCIFLNRKKN